MPTRRATLTLAAALIAGHAGARAQNKAAPDEASLRQTIADYVAAWNRHDEPAWQAFLTDDIWYTEADDYYQRMKGRAAVRTFFGDLVKTTDLKWDVKSVKAMPDGSASVVLSHVALILPKKGDTYASRFESTPSLARWRIEDGRWRMFYFTSHKGTALSEMKKDGIS